MPFTGKTGWGAFSSHCPEDGNIVVMFAPHVGIDSDGTIGKVLRQGQPCSSTSCGAAIGALGAVEKEEVVGKLPSGYHDHQMEVIKDLLRPHVNELKCSENKLVDLAYKMYEIQL